MSLSISTRACSNPFLLAFGKVLFMSSVFRGVQLGAAANLNLHDLDTSYLVIVLYKRSFFDTLIASSKMIEKSDDGDKQFTEEMVRAFSLLRASKAQFICHPERLDLQGDQRLT